MTRAGRVNSLEVAGSRFIRPFVIVNQNLPSHTVLCGNDYLAHVRLRLNIATQNATISLPSRYACQSGCIAIDSSGFARGAASIGGEAVPVLFDSGFNSTVRMPPSTFATIKLIPNGETAPYCGAASGAAEVNLDGAVVTSSVCSREFDAIDPIAIGARTFAAFRSVVIDYPDRLLQFIR